MPREIITLSVGQCGNQIGRRFWGMALEEHCGGSDDGHAAAATAAAAACYDDSMSSFFHRCADGKTLKARAVLVDMEEGPVAETLRGPLGSLFDARQFITDVSGAGNNFAHGHHVYGPQYGDRVLEAVRQAAEACDSLQSFFLMHSLGGGTGSGLGTYLLGLLEDGFPDVHRFVSAVFPSPDDDVVTSPYNSMLALHQLTQHADCVLPVENQSLAHLLDQHPSPLPSTTSTSTTSSSVRRRLLAAAAAAKLQQGIGQGQQGPPAQRRCGFDEMNGVMARVLIDLTASMRFAGDLNVDLNEVTTNLVPYPRLHYLMASLSHPATAPLNNGHGHGPLGGGGQAQETSRQLAAACEGAFAPRNQLMRADPRRGTVLACALLFRGRRLSLADVTGNVQRLQGQLRMIHWNPEGFKIGLCSRPALGSVVAGAAPPSAASSAPSLLCLSNNSCMAATFSRFAGRFQRLYKRRAMVHHYAQYMGGDAGAHFDAAYEDLLQLVDDYRGLEGPCPRIPGGQPPLAVPASGLFDHDGLGGGCEGGGGQ